jgi:hypothetical protein
MAVSCRKARCCVSGIELSGSTGSALEGKMSCTDKTSTKQSRKIAEFVEKLLWWQIYGLIRTSVMPYIMFSDIGRELVYNLFN